MFTSWIFWGTLLLTTGVGEVLGALAASSKSDKKLGWVLYSMGVGSCAFGTAILVSYAQ